MTEQEKLFQAETKRRNAFNMDSQHSHAYYEIYYLRSGKRYYFIDDRIFNVNQGDLIFIPNHVLHRTTAAGSEDHERTVIYFKPNFLKNIIPDFKQHVLMRCFYQNNKVLRLNLPEQNQIEGVIDKIMTETLHDKPQRYFYQQALLIELLVLVSRISPSESTEFESLNPIHAKIHKIVQYICNNYQVDINLGDLAEDFYISQYYLSRMFKEVTGVTLSEYINNVRIKAAGNLLKTTSLPMGTIAEMVGYESQTYFGRIFKRITGQTPSEFRKLTSSQ